MSGYAAYLAAQAEQNDVNATDAYRPTPVSNPTLDTQEEQEIQRQQALQLAYQQSLSQYGSPLSKTVGLYGGVGVGALVSAFALTDPDKPFMERFGQVVGNLTGVRPGVQLLRKVVNGVVLASHTLSSSANPKLMIANALHSALPSLMPGATPNQVRFARSLVDGAKEFARNNNPNGYYDDAGNWHPPLTVAERARNAGVATFKSYALSQMTPKHAAIINTLTNPHASADEIKAAKQQLMVQTLAYGVPPDMRAQYDQFADLHQQASLRFAQYQNLSGNAGALYDLKKQYEDPNGDANSSALTLLRTRMAYERAGSLLPPDGTQGDRIFMTHALMQAQGYNPQDANKALIKPGDTRSLSEILPETSLDRVTQAKLATQFDKWKTMSHLNQDYANARIALDQWTQNDVNGVHSQMRVNGQEPPARPRPAELDPRQIKRAAAIRLLDYRGQTLSTSHAAWSDINDEDLADWRRMVKYHQAANPQDILNQERKALYKKLVSSMEEQVPPDLLKHYRTAAALASFNDPDLPADIRARQEAALRDYITSYIPRDDPRYGRAQKALSYAMNPDAFTEDQARDEFMRLLPADPYAAQVMQGMNTIQQLRAGEVPDFEAHVRLMPGLYGAQREALLNLSRTFQDPTASQEAMEDAIFHSIGTMAPEATPYVEGVRTAVRGVRFLQGQPTPRLSPDELAAQGRTGAWQWARGFFGLPFGEDGAEVADQLRDTHAKVLGATRRIHAAVQAPAATLRAQGAEAAASLRPDAATTVVPPIATSFDPRSIGVPMFGSAANTSQAMLTHIPQSTLDQLDHSINTPYTAQSHTHSWLEFGSEADGEHEEQAQPETYQVENDSQPPIMFRPRVSLPDPPFAQSRIPAHMVENDDDLAALHSLPPGTVDPDTAIQQINADHASQATFNSHLDSSLLDPATANQVLAESSIDALDSTHTASTSAFAQAAAALSARGVDMRQVSATPPPPPATAAPTQDPDAANTATSTARPEVPPKPRVLKRPAADPAPPPAKRKSPPPKEVPKPKDLPVQAPTPADPKSSEQLTVAPAKPDPPASKARDSKSTDKPTADPRNPDVKPTSTSTSQKAPDPVGLTLKPKDTTSAPDIKVPDAPKNAPGTKPPDASSKDASPVKAPDSLVTAVHHGFNNLIDAGSKVAEDSQDTPQAKKRSFFDQFKQDIVDRVANAKDAWRRATQRDPPKVRFEDFRDDEPLFVGHSDPIRAAPVVPKTMTSRERAAAKKAQAETAAAASERARKQKQAADELNAEPELSSFERSLKQAKPMDYSTPTEVNLRKRKNIADEIPSGPPSLSKDTPTDPGSKEAYKLTEAAIKARNAQSQPIKDDEKDTRTAAQRKASVVAYAPHIQQAYDEYQKQTLTLKQFNKIREGTDTLEALRARQAAKAAVNGSAPNPYKIENLVQDAHQVGVGATPSGHSFPGITQPDPQASSTTGHIDIASTVSHSQIAPLPLHQLQADAQTHAITSAAPAAPVRPTTTTPVASMPAPSQAPSTSTVDPAVSTSGDGVEAANDDG